MTLVPLILISTLGLVCIVLAALLVITHITSTRNESEAARQIAECNKYISDATLRIKAISAENQKFKAENARLAKWSRFVDAEDRAKELAIRAKAIIEKAQSDVEAMRTAMGQYRENELAKTRQLLESEQRESRVQLAKEIEEAQDKLLDIRAQTMQLAAEARAKKNIIEGYGDEYLMPASSILDDLAEEFSHKDAGRQLKQAREYSRELIANQLAARCNYAESIRREGAVRFVLGAFNGKVDSTLSRVRHDNYGKLKQEIDDAYALVNKDGAAFRDARITQEYLVARQNELKWTVVVQELKRKEQEEQRRAKEQIREEEKARREYEKAMRDAAKEESLLRNAMIAAQAEIAAATEEQRAQYESQLAELSAKLQEAEDRNQRAISMAQQTRRGHVYVISNAGSFGENIYKIGLTRRLEPLDRVKELGDASVPFDFDVHAIIWSEDAPSLEKQLHNHFLLNQVNKVNHRKEFFRAKLSDIRKEIDDLGIEAKWTMVAEAREYRETIAIERAIECDAAAREAWLCRQLTLDPVDYLDIDTSEQGGDY